MRALLQRVSQASVRVAGQTVGAIGHGLVILLGVNRDDKAETAALLAERCCRLRIFEDDQGRMNHSLLDTNGSALVVSQFTLCADTRRGRRPSFDLAADAELARPLYELFVQELRKLNVTTATGSFGARMEVSLVNDGPVTIILDSSRPEGEKGS